MQLTTTTMQSIILLGAIALPSVHAAIAIGNQIKAGGTHYNVAWIEGLTPCSEDVVIAPESENLCSQNFKLDGTEYYLVGCTDPQTGYAQNPQRLRRVKDNSLYGTCSPVTRKEINCSGDVHDVIKRYLCG